MPDRMRKVIREEVKTWGLVLAILVSFIILRSC